MQPRSIFNDDQWSLFTALERAGAGSHIVLMPWTRLQRWLPGKSDSLLNDAHFSNVAQKNDARMLLRKIYAKANIDLALVVTENDAEYLGLAITDDAIVSRCLGKQGVRIMTWSTALEYLQRGQASSLIEIAENIIACNRTQAVISEHAEERIVKIELAKHLHLDWPDALDRAELDADTAQTVECLLNERKSQFPLFRDVAISRIVSVSADEKIDADMQHMVDTSDVDFLITHGKAPHIGPLLAIEYDGDVHRTDLRKKRNDAIKNRIFESAGIALLRINTEIAAARRPGRTPQSRHLRLAPMLEIARVILEQCVVMRIRAAEDRQRVQHDVDEVRTIAKALYGKDLRDLDRHQLVNALGTQRSAYQEERWMDDAERVVDDLDREREQRLESQLESLGIDPTCVSEVSIRSTPYGDIGKARLQLNDGGAVRSIETVAVSLSAPFMPKTTVQQLVRMQIHAELAYQAFELKKSG